MFFEIEKACELRERESIKWEGGQMGCLKGNLLMYASAACQTTYIGHLMPLPRPKA